MVWVTIAMFSAMLVGAFAKAYLNVPLPEGKQETVVIATFLQTYQPFIAGIFLCAILAAAMSTADSQLLVAASAFSEDFCQTILKRKFDPKTTVRVSRITVLAIAVIAFVLSLDENSSIFGLVSYAWAGFGATFGPLILLSLFWRNATAKGAIAGILAGGITVVAWHNIPATVAPIFGLYEILPGFIICLAACIIVSLLDKNKDPRVLADFDAYMEAED